MEPLELESYFPIWNIFINYLCTYFCSHYSGIFDQILHFYTYPSKFSFYFLALLSRSFPQLYFQFFFECFVSVTLYLISQSQFIFSDISFKNSIFSNGLIYSIIILRILMIYIYIYLEFSSHYIFIVFPKVVLFLFISTF